MHLSLPSFSLLPRAVIDHEPERASLGYSDSCTLFFSPAKPFLLGACMRLYLDFRTTNQEHVPCHEEIRVCIVKASFS